MKTHPNFKPMLLPNEEVNLKEVHYPMLCSFKYDGIRAVIVDGEIYSRSLKILPNINLHKKFANLKEYSLRNNVLLDGEFYCTSVNFNTLSGIIRSDEHELPYDLEFHCFDLLTEQNKPFQDRVKDYSYIREEGFVPVMQKEVNSADEVTALFAGALELGYEGLVLKDPSGYYKFGRATFKSNLGAKVKPFVSIDARIIGITQATEAREGSEKKINELGRSVTSKKKDDRVLINRAAGFVVLYNGKELEVGLAKHTQEMREHIWNNPSQYIGRMMEYKCMTVGMNEDGLPRHANFKRWRDDKDEE